MNVILKILRLFVLTSSSLVGAIDLDRVRINQAKDLAPWAGLRWNEIGRSLAWAQCKLYFVPGPEILKLGSI